MLVHTCIILVSMYLHWYSKFNVSPHMYYFSLHCYSEFNVSPPMYYFSLYVVKALEFSYDIY